ncbi:hypothetical protein FS842_009526 [Serendipita sp. 407]|nr:hypothetical protein FS842_009526 [Serendipita sp. 407]
MSTIMVLGAIQDTTIPATSPLVMYDEGWTNSTTNPAYMQVVNGSVYFSAKTSNISFHFLPAKQGNITIWIDGITRMEIAEGLERTSTNSSLDPTLREYPISLPEIDHQFHLKVSSQVRDDFFTLGGITLDANDGDFTPSMYGYNATIAPSDSVLVDSTALNYSTTGWDLQTTAPYSYKSTLSRTSTVGSTASLTFNEEVLNLWLFGRLSRTGATLNITFPSNNQVNYYTNYNVSRPSLNDTTGLMQAMIWSTGPIVTWPGSSLDITLTSGEFELDFIRYTVRSPSPSKLKQYIVVAIVIVSVSVLLALVIYFGMRAMRSRRRTRATSAEKKEAFDLEMDEVPFQHPAVTNESSGTTETLHLEIGGLGLSIGPPVPSNERLLPNQGDSSPSNQDLHSQRSPIVDPSLQISATGSPLTMPQSPAYSFPPLSVPTPAPTDSSRTPTQPEPAGLALYREEPPPAIGGNGAFSEALPEWSPPPPSYLTLAEMASEVRARGMIPLSQHSLERLFERVIALRRENMGSRPGSRVGPQGRTGGGGGGNHGGRWRAMDPGDMSASVIAEEQDEAEFEADLEALARQIAGISDSNSSPSAIQGLPPKR